MKNAFLIIAHRNPQQLTLLCDRLIREGGSVFVHIDLKKKAEFGDFIAAYGQRLRIYCTYKVRWGSYSQIQCTFHLLREALKHEFDYFTLLSGQDLPIKPLSAFREFLDQNKPNSFLKYYSLPAPEQLDGGGLDRVELLWLNSSSAALKRLSDKANVLIHFFQRRLGLRRTSETKYFAGPNWFTVHKSAASFALQKWDSDASFRRKFRLTRSADELVMQTILLNSPYRDSICNDNLVYVDWSSGEKHPKTLTVADARQLSSSGAFFARKFDPAVDPQIIKTILSGS